MVFATGDTHGYLNRFFDPAGELLPAYQNLTKDDVVIVAGDFGFVWNRPEIICRLERLKELPFQLAFVDGNHEDFHLLYSFPQEYWCGGLVHRIADNIVHLIRGEIFTIENNNIFVFGGAASTDRGWRVKGVSWWPEEIPGREDYDRALKNLQERGEEVDYIVTHNAPSFLLPMMNSKVYDLDAELTGFLAEVATVFAPNFKKWFYGHWHLDQEIYGRYRAISLDMVPITGLGE